MKLRKTKGLQTPFDFMFWDVTFCSPTREVHDETWGASSVQVLGQPAFGYLQGVGTGWTALWAALFGTLGTRDIYTPTHYLWSPWHPLHPFYPPFTIIT